MKYFICLAILLLAFSGLANQPSEIRIDPPHWWAGMNYSSLELLIEIKLKSNENYIISEVIGNNISMVKDEEAQNRDYHYVTLNIEPNAPSQKLKIMGWRTGDNSRVPISITYEFKSRRKNLHEFIGLDQRDLIYLVTPDRFVNGNKDNDIVKGLREKTINRNEGFSRHGGDLQGLTNHLDYIKSLGASAVWTNPILINDMPVYSYHGYAITDHYKVDPRFGGMKAYKKYSRELHKREMKLVMDVIPNHMGTYNRLFQHPPDSAWINSWPLNSDLDERGEVDSTALTNHRYTSIFDPYAAPIDKKQFTDGWFVHSMVDINQRDQRCSNYLIQNSLWWIEEVGVDAFRVDTWVYPDQNFMDNWSKQIHKVFPNFFIFSEAWVHDGSSQRFYFNEHKTLDGAADFMMYSSWKDALENPTTWNSGLNTFYKNLGLDYQYKSPSNFITFLDNHDEGRFFGKIKEDMSLYKMGIAMLYTMRGIPCLLYGTEILLKELDDHGKIREDMPGGWGEKKGDRNAFNNSDLSQDERDALSFVREMAQIRESYTLINTGSFRHWAPYDKVYAYCWYDDNEIVLILMNRSDREEIFDMNRMTELSFKDIEIILDTQLQMDFNESERVSKSNRVELGSNGLKILHLTR
ncbi:MAG: alpha-amylase family glycosyl hydrolase [Schleiferiaceae bacterium]|nr:alpha-amylase family glycosyl hydrolase [Schleiferiaceae bacterium]